MKETVLRTRKYDWNGQAGQPEGELRLLEQLTRMCDILSAKETELSEVRSELAYVEQEVETVKEELSGTQQELAQARSEMEESQTMMDNYAISWSDTRKTIKQSVYRENCRRCMRLKD